MKRNNLKILLIGGLIFGLATPSVLNANEFVEEDLILEEVNEENENDENPEVIFDNEVEETKSEEQPLSEEITLDVQSLTARSNTLVADQTTLKEAFPDANFRTYVAESILGLTSGSYNENTVLSAANISAITSTTTISAESRNITSLSGVEYFTNLTTLTCHSNQLTELNISALTKLRSLNCYNNQLNSLDLTGLTELRSLSCQTNNISVLDVSALVNLTSLSCQSNKLTELNVSSLTNLVVLNCYINNISELDVSRLTKLTILQCYDNNISELDVSDLLKLQTLNCQKNSISVLDVSNLVELKTLNCYTNAIEVLDVSDLVKLTTLHCYYNEISTLDVTNLINLTSINCTDNNVNTLNVSNLDNLVTLAVGSNPISGLNVSALSKQKITTFRYDYTNIDTLDLSGFSALKVLSVTKATNGELSNLTSFYISSDKALGETVVRVRGEAGYISWNATVGYYVIDANKNVTYATGVSYQDADGNQQMVVADYLKITESTLMDSAGNLIVGADITNVDPATGAISLPNGGKFINGDTTYIFDGNTTITETDVTTDGTIIVEKNIPEVNTETGETGVNIGGNQTNIELPAGEEATLDVITGNLELPEGSVVTNNDGDKTYLITDGACDSEGNVTSSGTLITVPSEKTEGIKVNDDGTITMPPGTMIIDENGVITTPEGGLLYNPETGEITVISSDTLQMVGTPEGTITVGDTFTLSINIPNGEWNHSQEHLDFKVLDNGVTTRSTVLGNSITFTAKKSGTTTITYSINGVVKEAKIVIVDKVVEPKPTDPTEPTTPEDPSKPILPKPVDPQVSKPSVAGGSTTTESVVNAGDTTNLTLLYAMLGTSLLGLLVIIKRKKEGNKC